MPLFLNKAEELRLQGYPDQNGISGFAEINHFAKINHYRCPTKFPSGVSNKSMQALLTGVLNTIP